MCIQRKGTAKPKSDSYCFGVQIVELGIQIMDLVSQIIAFEFPNLSFGHVSLGLGSPNNEFRYPDLGFGDILEPI